MAGESTVQDKAATETGAQPSSTAADNKVHVDRHEYETLVRNSERLKGNDAFFRKAQEAGFKDTADFDRMKPALNALKKHDPQIGGYYVVYPGDGYKSWSPAQAFEEGYTREGAGP